MKKATMPLVTLSLGAALGGLAGVLFAPRKGAITRARIKNKMEEAKEDAEQKANRAKAKANELKDRFKKKDNVPFEM